MRVLRKLQREVLSHHSCLSTSEGRRSHRMGSIGWLISSKAKFEVTVTTVLRNRSVLTRYLRAHKSPSRVRFRANRTLSRTSPNDRV
jgi:hypothetical protein